MSRLKLVVAFSVALFSCASSSAALAETIKDFHSDIELKPDSSLSINETVIIDFGNDRRHGIFRDIPLSYECRNHEKNGMHVEVGGASCDGKACAYVTKYQDGNLDIKMGDPARTLSGVHKYLIVYRAFNAVGFFDGRPEVYWNVTGGQWPFAIQHVSAKVYTSSMIKPVQHASYSGETGSKQQGLTTVKNNALFFETRHLKPYDGLTIAAQYPVGTAQAPHWFTRLSWYIEDSALWLKTVPWEMMPVALFYVFIGGIGTIFGTKGGLMGSDGGGWSGGGAGGGGGGSW